jgi:hypothetical protein
MSTILVVKGTGDGGIMVVDRLADQWVEDGHRVVTHFGPADLPDADVVFLHVDATRVPEDYQESLRRFPVVINRRAVDISKPLYSAGLVREGDDYEGPVVVKTRLNFGGIPEYRRRGGTWQPGEGPRSGDWSELEWLNPHDYPIFERKQDVPGGVWSNPALMVERFLPEVEGDLFYLRYWVFFGDEGWAARFGSKAPIAKWHTAVTAHEPVAVPPELVELRERMGLDYGRMDYAVRNGEPVVFDVNKTVSADGDASEYRDAVKGFARGIEKFIRLAAAAS